MKQLKARKGPWLVSLGSALWATDSLFRSNLISKFPTMFIVFLDHLLAMLVAIPLFLREWKQILKFNLKDWLSLVGISLGGSVLGLVFFTQSFAITSNYTVPVLIQKVQPIIAILLAALILKEKLTKNFWLWSAIAIIGAYFVSFGTLSVSLENAAWLPVFYAFLAAVFWGSSTVFGKYLSKKYTFSFITSVRYIGGLIWLAIIMLFMNQWFEFTNLDGKSLLIFLGIALIPGFLALIIYYMGLKTTKASVATICELTFPLTAIVLNWILLDSALNLIQILGAIVLLGAITMLSLKGQKK
ncbi:MAG: DMT family transporter [Nanoarchaeota archaeon]|nr:DMT family transporter [Nanoarchaeota archaeon]